MSGLNDRGAYLTLDLPDGRVVDVVPIMFGQARLCIAPNRTDIGYGAVY